MKSAFGALKPRRRLKRFAARRMMRAVVMIMGVCLVLFILLLVLFFNESSKPKPTKNSAIPMWEAEEIAQNNIGRELLRLRTWKTAKERKVTMPSSEGVVAEKTGVYAKRYAPVAADEILRDGEAYITFDEYIACVEKVLRVDVKKQEELPWVRDDVALPYVLLPVRVELSDVKATLCSLEVRIQRLMYAVEGTSPTTVAFFEDVQSIFNFTDRLKVRWAPDLLGFAHLVNAGLLDAMQHPREAVPFFTVMNHSVRIPAVTMRASVRSFYNSSSADAAKITALERDVGTEPNKHSPGVFPCAVRGFTNQTLVSTSSLLPDSIRYLPVLQLQEQFASFDGLLLFEGLKDFQRDVFTITRFALETVGFMDENLLDPMDVVRDWENRRAALGFRVLPLPDEVASHPLKRFVDAKSLLADKFDLSPSSFTAAQTWAKMLNHLEYAPLDYAYLNRKYGDVPDKDASPPYGSGPNLPLDAWVLDLHRRKALFLLLQATKDYFFNKDIVHKKKRNLKKPTNGSRVTRGPQCWVGYSLM
ncbi:galactofuranosyltransferase [Strigomonas culicis]|uniref:Galactofuranosyltransferase n=1 Tax=Strigomonas culicis TaxID=28005 RepID=S9US00_9TRYP|nr:galactofuranosyltransferase [Strigomonas culicis]|eukprot:EPY17381.1 galactofuranosyltransferase [Strigomonas culicis]